MTDLARLRRLVTTNEPASDADLLDRFVTDRDGPAFAALVRRHGPMVLAVCRRVLRHRQDAEDAFQATFLVLARRAGAVEPRALLANWLYGVAYRTALGARRVASGRRAREARAAAQRSEELVPDETGLAPELLEALDRELAVLPNVYRAAVVACDLEGLTRREAAGRLGWTEGTLSSRLARARALLARRMSRYGFAVPAAGLVPVTGLPAVATELADPTIRLSVLLATGEAVVAAPVAALMEGMMRTMLLTKLKTIVTTAVVACAVAVVSTAGWQANTAIADSPKEADTPKTEKPKRVAPNPDKERIAELERERDQLRKEVAELRDRLVKADAERRALLTRAELEDFRRRVRELESRALPNTPSPELNKTPSDLPYKPSVPKTPAESLPTPTPKAPAPESSSNPSDPALTPKTTLRGNLPAPAPESSILPSDPALTPKAPAPELNDLPSGSSPAPKAPAYGKISDPSSKTPAGSVPLTSKVPEPNTPRSDPSRTSPPKTPAIDRGTNRAGGDPEYKTPVLPPKDPFVPAPSTEVAVPEKAKAVVRVYPVGELAKDEKEGDALAKVLRAAVAPKSWGADAGVEYLPGRRVLVVRQTVQGHAEVAELLKLLQVQSGPDRK